MWYLGVVFLKKIAQRINLIQCHLSKSTEMPFANIVAERFMISW